MQPSPKMMEDDLRELRRLVDEQEGDAALWLAPSSLGVRPALRRLHEAIERATRWME